MADDLATRVISEVNRVCDIEFVEFGDDDVFLDQLPEGDVYSDMQPPYGRNSIPQRVADSNGRQRRTSDVIDCLGEELVTMRVHGSPSDPYSIPHSPRSRSSSDLGYSGSITSSPATLFNFPSSVMHSGHPGSARRNNNTTDSRPIDISEQVARDVPEARMPVTQDSEAYNMSHARRGRAVIFNHDAFDGNMASQRNGSLVDVNALEAVFQELGFQVTTYNNLSHSDIKEAIYCLAKEDHSDADCLSITVLTHGLDNGLLYARDALYPVDSLWTQFTADNAPTLAGKPKMFFVQACRGEKLDGGVSLVSRRSMSETDSGCNAYKIPSHADFLVSYSSMPGFYSWRNPTEGTWFIQSLAEELRLHGDKRNLHDIMTRVCRRVALYYQSNAADFIWMHNQKQCPIFHSSLMRDVIFLPKT